ncbi:MAG: cardiolipin synthase B [Betaproteobacteria bacterium]|nr:MAG: cardiolipin synthase B [Betaproteobacteria bacterium]
MLAALEGCALSSPASAPARQPAPPASLTSPLTQGNEARILVDGPATHAAMRAAIARARDHVNLESYIVDDSPVGERLAELLKKKAAQGVKVNLLYDSVGSIKTPREFFERLRKAGIAVCEFNPVKREPAKLNNRDHRKILVVDGRVAFTGGVNISETYASGSARARSQPGKERDRKDGWRDTHVQVEGPVVAQLQRLSLDAWALQDCGPAPEARYFPPLERRGDKAMRVVRTDPDSGKSEMYAVLLDQIGKARSRVWLTMGYFVPDPRTKEALMQAARRGVDVRLVLPGFSDFWAPVYAGRSHYEDLLGAGVRIYEWHEALMHAKTAVIDSAWSSVGSTNLDWRSFVHNYEDNLVVQDAGFARQMEQRFREDVAASVEVDPAAWRARRPGEKLKEWFARQWEYLL